MTENNGPTQPLSVFRKIVEEENRQRQPAIDECIAYLTRNELPTSGSIRETINSLVGETRQHVLSHHIYWKEWTLRRGVTSLVHACHQASMDICRHDAALGELARSETFQDKVDYVVGHAAQKDVVAYCALVFGVKDTLKDIEKLRPDIADQLCTLRDSIFNRNISEFLRNLRNNLLHGQVTIPYWEISYDLEHGNSSTGSMMYNAKDLMRFGRWNEESRRYVLTFRDGKTHLSSIIREHFQLLSGICRAIDDVFSRHMTSCEKDFFDIEDTHKRKGRRQWTKVIVKQMASGKNPYDYLHKCFDPKTLREILRRPAHSKEQVDFIMDLQAVEIDWDHELRNMMYEKFGVASDSK